MDAERMSNVRPCGYLLRPWDFSNAVDQQVSGHSKTSEKALAGSALHDHLVATCDRLLLAAGLMDAYRFFYDRSRQGLKTAYAGTAVLNSRSERISLRRTRVLTAACTALFDRPVSSAIV